LSARLNYFANILFFGVPFTQITVQDIVQFTSYKFQYGVPP